MHFLIQICLFVQKLLFYATSAEAVEDSLWRKNTLIKDFCREKKQNALESLRNYLYEGDWQWWHKTAILLIYLQCLSSTSEISYIL